MIEQLQNLSVAFALIVLSLFCFGGAVIGVLRTMKRAGVLGLPKSALAVLTVMLFCTTMQAQKVMRCHVDASAEGGGDGSEERPFRDIQAGVESFAEKTNQFEVVVEPGVYGPVDLGGLKVRIGVSTNDGERVIDGSGAEWAVRATSLAEEGLSSLSGFFVANAQNGVTGVRLSGCRIEDVAGFGISNCVASSSFVSGAKVGAADSSISSMRIYGCDVGVSGCVLTNGTVTGCTAVGLVDSDVSHVYITNNPCCAVLNCRVDTCLIAENGVGIRNGAVFGSTIAANRYGGAFDDVVACNTVLAYNKDGKGHYLNFAGDGIVMTNCCTSPLPESGTNNVLCGVPIHPRTYRLRVGSPAIGAGATNILLSATDLDGVSRRRSGATDIGAFMFRIFKKPDCTSQSPVPVPYDWLKEKLRATYNDKKGKGLITEWEDDGSYVRFNYDRYIDGMLWVKLYAYITCETMAMYESERKFLPDGSQMSWWQEYLAGTDPNDPDDVLKVDISMEAGKPTITWSPDLGDERLYLILGVRELGDEWELIDDLETTDCRFFKVSIELDR